MLTTMDKEFISIETRKYGEYGKGSLSTSKFVSGEYYNSENTKWKQLDRSLKRSAFAVSREQNDSKSYYKKIEKYLSEYIGSRDYKQIGDYVIVKANFFNDLLTTNEHVESTIDTIVEETAINRMDEPLKYDLSEVMEKLDFDDGDLKDILALLEDEDF